MAHYKRLSDGRYKVRWRKPDGSGERSRIAPDLATAKAIKRQVEQCVALGEDWQPRRALPTAGDLLADFYAERKRVVREGRAGILATTFGQFLEFAAADTGRPEDRVPLSVFSKTTIGRFYDALRERGMGANTANRRVADMNAAWKWAITDERFVGLVKPFSPVALPKAYVEHQPVRVGWDVLDLFLATAAAPRRGGLPSPAYTAVWTFQRFTGLRARQVIRLERRDLDAEAGTLRIRAEIAKHPNHARVIAVSKHLVNWLDGQGLLKQQANAPLVGKWVKRTAFNKAQLRTWKRSGIDPAAYQGQSGKVFRVSFINNMLQLGVDFGRVQLLVGHVDNTTARSYLDRTGGMLPKLREDVALIPPLATGVRPMGVSGDGVRLSA